MVRKVLLACLLLVLLPSLAPTARSEGWEYNGPLFAEAVAVKGLKVSLADNSVDGCWTNQAAVLAAVKARLASQGMPLSDEKGKYVYQLHLHVLGYELTKADGAKLGCIGHLSYSLSTMFFGAVNKATEPKLFYAEVGRGAGLMARTDTLDLEILRIAEVAADALVAKLGALGKLP